ncbi:hypothetical protein BDK51DRAFT_44329 [Blyttiomyces helicus]|uniref:Uncharacterized protein n=1 Tax=Blyttiomyces helicus TaxID=388810 RepID=A0A4P9WAY9_9FUNG|nr:hypothetical protein BDK51DRAFT_44329 [Blyttiomyces helicus]|eukprot:RKO89781.1 hypothetical protein BDK51DRAFT_44329 [Blyttiomyces helicus]
MPTLVAFAFFTQTLPYAELGFWETREGRHLREGMREGIARLRLLRFHIETAPADTLYNLGHVNQSVARAVRGGRPARHPDPSGDAGLKPQAPDFPHIPHPPPPLPTLHTHPPHPCPQFHPTPQPNLPLLRHLPHAARHCPLLTELDISNNCIDSKVFNLLGSHPPLTVLLVNFCEQDVTGSQRNPHRRGKTRDVGSRVVEYGRNDCYRRYRCWAAGSSTLGLLKQPEESGLSYLCEALPDVEIAALTDEKGAERRRNRRVRVGMFGDPDRRLMAPRGLDMLEIAGVDGYCRDVPAKIYASPFRSSDAQPTAGLAHKLLGPRRTRVEKTVRKMSEFQAEEVTLGNK